MQFPRNHLYESVPCTEKRPRKPQTGSKVGCEEMVWSTNFRLEYSVREKNRTTFLGFSVATT